MKKLIFLFAIMSLHFQCTNLSKPIHSDVPSKRLLNGVYYSPNNEFSIDVSYLIQMGIIIEERSPNSNFKVLFKDTMGTSYSVDRYDYRYFKYEMNWTFDSIIYYANERFKTINSHYINSNYGLEYRFNTIEHNSETIFKWIEDHFSNKIIKSHTVNAKSLFIYSNYIYDISVSMFFHDSTYVTNAVDISKSKLSVFISKMNIK